MSGILTLGKWLNEGASFGVLISAISQSVLPWVFYLWVLRWLYNILIDMGNGGRK